MSTPEFETLSVGVRFGAKAAEAKQLFSRRPAQVLNAAKNDDAATASAQDSLRINVPPPSSLSLFKKAAAPTHSDAAAPEVEHALEPLHKPGPSKVRQILKDADITSTAFDFVPLKGFEDLHRPPFNVDSNIVKNLSSRDHTTATPIQMVAIPLLLAGRDVLACAPTGSGKTLAFLVPLFARLKKPNKDAGVRAIILCPTKELAVQIEREAFFLLKGDRWRLVQHGQTTKDKDIMVTTPARCATMITEKKLDVSKVEFIVFDEGDKLWDSSNDNMHDTDQIIAACTNPEKVVCFFSATLTERAERLARTVMHDPVRVIVKGRVEANTDVDHRLTFVGSELGKIVAVRNLVREGVKPPILIFVQTIERTKELFDEIKSAGLRVAVLNSKMSTEERDDTVLNFRMGRIWVLICTELMARGVDFKNVGTVINFDLPLTLESYVHRCGRTGRAGRKGVAITFFTEDDKERLLPIAKAIHRTGSQVEPWILEKLRPASRQRRKELEHTVPTRMVVSTKKRIVIGQKRIERQVRAAERERAAKVHRPEAELDAEADDDYDSDEE